MNEVKAYRCDYTAQIFDNESEAARSEFNALLQRLGGKMPAMGSVNSKDIMTWLAGNMQSGIYPTAADAFIEAAKYLSENRERLKR